MENLGDKQWYVVNTYSGHERNVADYLEKRRDSMMLQDYVFRIVVAEYTEPVLNKDGKPTNRVKTKNLYPGYVFIEMIMTDDAWFMVRNTPGVTGFVGSSGGGTKPFPIPREEIEHLKDLKVKLILSIQKTLKLQFQLYSSVELLQLQLSSQKLKRYKIIACLMQVFILHKNENSIDFIFKIL